MGVTIHYRGKLGDINTLVALCDELTMVAAKMDWSYRRLDEDWSEPASASIEAVERGARIRGHLPLKGISLAVHPQCESLCFFFDSNGSLCDPISKVRICQDDLKPKEAWVSVKTQFAGPEIHIWIIGLLKYLEKHFITDLEINDEGEYWETADPERLKAKMDFINDKIDALSNELSRVSSEHIDKFSPDELASTIEALVRNKFKKNNN